MAVAASIAVEERSVQARMASPSRFGDKAFEWLTLAMALAVVVLIVLIGWQLWIGSSVAIKKFGFHFLVTSTWDPVAEQFGALPFIYGTLVLKCFFGWTPFFSGPIYGPSILAGGIIIAVMILPIITSVSREILRSVPDLQREAAYGLGATRWEATRIAVLSYAKKGLFGAVILGLGRALGETMAVTMVIGNTPQIAASLFKPGYTLASVLANEFTEATTDMYLQALFEIGLVLFGITILVNLLAQLLLRTIATTSATRAVQ